MKKYYPLFLLFLITIPFYSQPGVKAGINLSSLRSDADKSKFMPGFHVGGFYDLKLTGNLYLQPNFLFSYDPTETEYNNKNDKIKNTGFYITSPVMLSYRQPINNNGKIIFDLGAYLSVGILGDYKIQKVENGQYKQLSEPLFKYYRERLEAGLIGGMGYEINDYIFSSHLRYGFNSVTLDYDYTILLMFSVAYRFGK